MTRMTLTVIYDHHQYDDHVSEDDPYAQARPPAYTRNPVQSTFSSPGATKPAMYKAESMTLETMRGDRPNHSSFFPEQGGWWSPGMHGGEIEPCTGHY